MVGRDGVQNPVSLNSVLTNASRAVAGLLIATAGVGVRFLANPVSFAAVLVAPAGSGPKRCTPRRQQGGKQAKYASDVDALYN